VQRISRSIRAILTIFAVLNVALGFYLTTYIWANDSVLADLNGVDVSGTVNKYETWRTCFVNLGLLMTGSLYTMVFDWNEGKYMILVTGCVSRQAVLELDSLLELVVGDYIYNE
jgi:hypothetical protein